jgi:iron complex transport system substrate-binding protein
MLLSACVPQTQAEVPHLHPTIVSLNPCADAILAEVADPGQVLAISHYSADPRSASMPAAQARRYRTTRGTVEEVVALHPDVVIDGSFIAPATAGAYARLGLRLETVGTANTVDDAHAQVRQLALLAGHPERGEALIARIDAALAAAAPAPGSAPIPAVMWESGGMVPGDQTLIADLMRRTGFSNASAAKGYGQADILPLERLLADPPRVIFTTAAGEGAHDADRMLTHPALATLKGVKRAPFAPNLLYCAGPTLIRAAARLAEMRSALSPLPGGEGLGVGERGRQATRLPARSNPHPNPSPPGRGFPRGAEGAS